MRERAFALKHAALHLCAWLFAIAMLLVPSRATADDAACDARNVMEHAQLVRWVETTNATALLTDGVVLPEGATLESQAITFTTSASSLTFDLGADVTIGAVYVQGDARASFALLLSQDARSWRKITIGPVEGPGLRSRSSAIDPIMARYVRIGEPSPAPARISELQLGCRLPDARPVHMLDRDPEPLAPMPADSWRARVWYRLTGVPVLTPAQSLALKLGLSLLAVLLLASRAKRFTRARDAILLVVAVTSFTGYYNWGAYRFPDYAHAHELFHYVIGGKYFGELGYTRLYDCANAVDAEQGLRARAESRHVRDLRDNEIIDGKTSLERADECKRAFTPARWDAFAHDVAWFRDHASPGSWDRVLRDHGYNPSPAWAMLGSPIANLRPASRSFVGYADSMTTGALALIDPALVAIAFAAMAWAFGWRAACASAIVFGCNPLASFLWTGGAYLREDWFALVMIGVACLKKERFAIGGACLAYATLLRVFPGALLFVIALRMAWTAWRERRVERDLARVLAGAAVASVAIAGISSAVAGGFHAWVDFAHNTAKLAASPSVNLVGLRTLLSFRPSTRADVLFDPTLADPYAAIIAARHANFARALPVFVLALVAFFALLVRAIRRTTDAWILACLGVALIPIATELSCYYSSFLVAAALLLRERPRVLLALVASCAVLLALHLALDNDVLYACASVVVVAFALWMVWECGGPARAREDEEPISRSTWVCGAAAIAIVIAVSLATPRDALMDADGACEARWTALADAFHARAELAPKHASTLHIAGDDFTDEAKVAAFARAQQPDDAQIQAARAKYDEAVGAFDAALDRAEKPAINRATGEVFKPRVALAGAR